MAIDLPGFGSSSKPRRAPFDPPWFARSILRFMDSLEVDRAHLVGNSLGGRVALEVGMEAPDRVASLSLLDRKSTRLNSSHFVPSRMPSSA